MSTLGCMIRIYTILLIHEIKYVHDFNEKTNNQVRFSELYYMREYVDSEITLKSSTNIDLKCISLKLLSKTLNIQLYIFNYLTYLMHRTSVQ